LKGLHIIESETPGITKIKLKTSDRKPMFAKGSNSERSDWSSYKMFKKYKKYKNKKILKMYRSSWNSDEFFIKHFM
jgi:hypothetical protein